MTDPKDRPLSELSIEELRAELARREAEQGLLPLPADVGDLMTSIELSVEESAASYKLAAVEARLAKLGPETGESKPCPRCGQLIAVKAKNKKRVLRTLSARLTIHRNYHYCRCCKHGFFPRDRELGLPTRGSVTYELEKRI